MNSNTINDFPKMEDLKYKDNNLYIFDVNNWSIPFNINKSNSFTKEEIENVFNFAFQGKSNHRDYRSGGIEIRNDIKKFFNIFLGKLGEIATYNNLVEKGVKLKNYIDYEVRNKGNWDDCDLVTINDKKISVKSSKSYSNMMLLEKKDYNGKGQLIYNIGTNKTFDFDYFTYVRIAPTLNNQVIFEGYGQNYKFNNLEELEKELKEFVFKYNWVYEEPFIITKDKFVNTVIANDYYIKQRFLVKFDKYCNVLFNLSLKNKTEEQINDYIERIFNSKATSFVLDADNYYFPLKYMNRIKDLLIDKNL